jgi:hypothetical protein
VTPPVTPPVSPSCDCGSQGCTNQCCVPCGGFSSGGQCVAC